MIWHKFNETLGAENEKNKEAGDNCLLKAGKLYLIHTHDDYYHVAQFNGIYFLNYPLRVKSWSEFNPDDLD